METESAKEALQSLLTSGNISRAVYIDDVFAFQNQADVEQVIGWFSKALTKSEEKTLALVSVVYPVPDEGIWRTEFREKWDRLDPDEKANVINALLEVLNFQLNKDKEIASELKQLFPAGFDYREVSPSVWIKQKGQILADIPENSHIICLFDQDLSAEPSFTGKGTFSGGGLLKDLVESHDKENLLCGILSHTIPTIEAEHDYHKTFAAEYQIGELDPKKFLPLAKFRLSEPIKFVDGFKKLLLHELCEGIKQSALEVLHAAHTTAIEKIQALDIYAFDRMILKAAHQANEWEIETIVRLFQIYQRNELRLRLADPDIANSLSELITKVRPTSQVETVVEEYVYPKVRAIRREELYEKADLIKHRPIETGDIFVCNEGTDQQKFYVLLAQPCDLAVRLQGTRVQEFVSLVPIKKVNNLSSKKKVIDKLEWKNYWSTRAIIDNFFDDPQELAVLEFKDVITVKTVILDLAVLDSEGFCKIDIHHVEVPNHLTQGWKTLLENRKEFYIQIDTKLQQKEATLPEFSFPSVLPPVQYSNGIFDFGLRRVERYRQPCADGLLKAYTQFLSREAKDFNFAG